MRVSVEINGPTSVDELLKLLAETGLLIIEDEKDNTPKAVVLAATFPVREWIQQAIERGEPYPWKTNIV